MRPTEIRRAEKSPYKLERSLEGKVALITGAASGIGRATAYALAAHGADLVLADVQSAQGEALAHEIREHRSAAQFISCDVSNPEEVQQLIRSTLRIFDHLDFAFNNAGIEGANAPTAECTNQNWQQTLNVNLSGIFYCMREEILVMLKQGGGQIVNCSSIAGLRGFRGMPAYTASKHGILGLTRSAALDYADQNIRINAICPGVIRTPMVDRLTGGSDIELQNLTRDEPMGRAGEAREIADAVLWLASPLASFVTGTEIIVDGGWCAK